MYINREAVEFNNEPWECQGMHFALYPQGIWLGPQSQIHPAPKKQISEQVCKSEILVISFVQGNFNRVLEGREVRNVLFLVIP